MKLDYLSTENFKEMIRKAVSRHVSLSDYRLFFFGSRIRGDSFSRSDIDVGIEGKKKIPASVKLAINEELENLPTLYKLEVVDFKDVSTSFKKEALKFTERIN